MASNIMVAPVSTGIPTQVLQFENHDPQRTNTIDLWDVAPRGVFYTNATDREAGKYLKIVEREFEHCGKSYRLTIKPARLRRSGQETEEYPGEREQLVEEVVRRLAQESGRLRLDGRDLWMTFSINEICEELARTGHRYSWSEVKEALQILHLSPVEITRVDADPKSETGSIVNIISASAFPQLAFRERGREFSETSVQFNALLTSAIKHLEFMQLDYDTIMSLKGPVPRWLYKRLSHNVFYGDHESHVQVLTASQLYQGCGLPPRSRKRDELRKITGAIDALKSAGVILGYELEDVHDGVDRRRKEDIIYTVHLSKNFIEDVTVAKKRHQLIKSDYIQIEGTEPKDFMPGSVQKRDQLRRKRATRKATDQPELQF
ncbi:hypothetical protein ACFOYU_19160 [Microvirga sp. GCM10011540]|uniref:hypothetical protein n=1 Tax=Microvirga sp. GCM10011540 TaxID=3317338 RepID=UPI003618A265